MTRPSAESAAVEQGIPVVIRTLKTAEDFAACVRLQHDTWGDEFADYVPASLLKVVQTVGGVTVGAFSPDGRMVGFVFGLTGVLGGRQVHWSHMLAVEREYRDHGLGRRLKEYQRELLRGQGIELIYWTFDPLVARNAHLNLNRLGTEIREYVPDMYGETGSPLHNLGTDRFVVSWAVGAGGAVGVAASWRQAPIVAAGLAAEMVAPGNGDGRPYLRIEIPADIEVVGAAEARQWRMATRAAFVRLMDGGYRVVGFYTEERRRCFYVLAHASAASVR